jgi:hypothetical protein
MIRLFLGYRNTIGHLFEDGPHMHPDDDFSPEIREWCNANLKGHVAPIYVDVYFKDGDGELRRGGRFEFDFEYEEDAVLFKLFHIG